MKIIRNIVLTGLLLIPFVLSAQEEQNGEFSISAQLRARGEYRNGALNPRVEGTESATFINNRARLSMLYKRSNLEFKISGQHVGVWGKEPQVDRNGDFMLNEAWAKLSSKNGFFFAQLGRQTLSYDDERILGGLDWNTSGRHHDLLKLGIEKNLSTLHLVFAFNQNDEKINGGDYYDSGGQPYKSMQTLWYHYGNSLKNSQPFGISLLAMNLGWEMGKLNNSSNSFMQTLGTHITYNKRAWSLSGSFYYQTGENKAAQSVSAYMGSILAGVNLSPKWRISLGSDYLSGASLDDYDDEGELSKYKAFDPLYGTHHKFYGTMDYFYASNFANGLNPGLWDNHIGLSYKTGKKVDMSLNYHYFSMARKIEVIDLISRELKTISKGLGSELDFQLNWSVMPDVKINAGYSVMLAQKSMNIVKGGDNKRWQDWAWVSINITPNLFSTKR